jgi:hypothetical protein
MVARLGTVCVHVRLVLLALPKVRPRAAVHVMVHQRIEAPGVYDRPHTNKRETELAKNRRCAED